MAGAMGGTTGPPAGVGTVVEVVEDRLFGPLIAFGAGWRPGRPARSKDCAGFARPVQLSAASTDSRSPGNAAVNVTRSPVAGCSKDSRRACSHTRPRASRGRPAGH